MLQLESVVLKHNDRVVVNGISLSVSPGQIHGIIGASGEGKSTLLKAIGGYHQVSEGSIRLNDKRVLGPHDKLVPGHDDICLVNQDFRLDIYHTVEENVIQAMLYLPNELRQTYAEELLELVDLTHLKQQEARYLSGGEQQRLAIIRALAQEPSILLLDEPFSHLDVHLKRKIGSYIKALIEVRDMAVIMVSHEGQDILEWCEVVHYLKNGQFVRSDEPMNFYFSPSTETEALYFGAINAYKKDGKTILFRPTEYVLDDNGESCKVLNSMFCGAYFRNHVQVSKQSEWILYSEKPLPKTIKVKIRKFDH